MKRTHVQLDEPTFKALRDKAVERQISVVALIREMLHAQLGTPAKPGRANDFQFIGAGRSQPSRFDQISERPDEALAQDFAW